jgi:hypothetical protein
VIQFSTPDDLQEQSTADEQTVYILPRRLALCQVVSFARFAHRAYLGYNTTIVTLSK